MVIKPGMLMFLGNSKLLGLFFVWLEKLVYDIFSNFVDFEMLTKYLDELFIFLTVFVSIFFINN